MTTWHIPGGDWSFDPPNLNDWATDGNQWVGAYILGPLVVDGKPNEKVLTPATLAKLHSLHQSILCIGEWTEQRALSGMAGGVADATAMRARMKFLGNDTAVTVPAIDWNATTTQMRGPVRDYFVGWQKVFGLARTWAYGGGHQIDYLFDNKLISGAMQAVAASSWGPIDTRATVRQEHNGVKRYGGEVDLGHASSLTGMWAPATPTPPPSAFHYATVTSWPSAHSTLSGIAAAVYGDASEWQRIYAANKKGVKRADGKIGMIVDPDVLVSGWVLLIP